MVILGFPRQTYNSQAHNNCFVAKRFSFCNSSCIQYLPEYSDASNTESTVFALCTITMYRHCKFDRRQNWNGIVFPPTPFPLLSVTFVNFIIITTLISDEHSDWRALFRYRFWDTRVRMRMGYFIFFTQGEQTFGFTYVDFPS